jgi:amino acid permease
VAALILAIVIAVFADPDDAANWVGIIRDLFIIVLAMEGMLIGIAFIVLIVQLAALLNLLQNEIQPIVDNANETVSTVRGTAQFMSQNVVEPVLKFGALAAGVGAVMREMIGIRQSLRSGSKNGSKKD